MTPIAIAMLKAVAFTCFAGAAAVSIGAIVAILWTARDKIVAALRGQGK